MPAAKGGVRRDDRRRHVVASFNGLLAISRIDAEDRCAAHELAARQQNDQAGEVATTKMSITVDRPGRERTRERRRRTDTTSEAKPTMGRTASAAAMDGAERGLETALGQKDAQ